MVRSRRRAKYVAPSHPPWQQQAAGAGAAPDLPPPPAAPPRQQQAAGASAARGLFTYPLVAAAEEQQGTTAELNTSSSRRAGVRDWTQTGQQGNVSMAYTPCGAWQSGVPNYLKTTPLRSKNYLALSGAQCLSKDKHLNSCDFATCEARRTSTLRHAVVSAAAEGAQLQQASHGCGCTRGSVAWQLLPLLEGEWGAVGAVFVPVDMHLTLEAVSSSP
ncbi:hypothetical protein HaLaN_09266 [Haematococcus lacustris]|uniref:Uncharacterized protein n=1 Tax=Haematococcus lacustris TaxID=44745 RepID=A0A699YU95_HAELA|nr:hypothetical protein HaLaN_09266 [Haematococcus lacustris]